VREGGAALLREAFGIELESGETPRTEVLQGDVRIAAQLSAPTLKARQITDLHVRIVVPPDHHLIGGEPREGFFATEVQVTSPLAVEALEPRYPSPAIGHLPGVADEVAIYLGEIDIVVPLDSKLRDGGPIPLEIEVRYQLCNERECFLPQTARLHLDVPVGELVRRQRPE